MSRPLRILHLEDDPDYSALVKSLLKDEGIDAEMVQVSSRDEFESALVNGNFDVLIADYTLPEYNGLKALEVARRHCPQTPFLLVSGTIAEHAAIESLKLGATDYVLKHWPERLVPAVRRAVGEAEERSQRRRMETELVRRERYFRTLTENSVDVLSLLDREGKFLYSSPSVERVLGYTTAELKSKPCFELIHPDDTPQIQQAFAEALQHSERLITVEFRFQHKNGSWRYFESVGQNRLDDPDIGAVVVNSREISDRKKAEAELRESEQQYRLIFDGNPTPMWVFDHATLAFLEVNDAAVQHYGFSREEFLAMTVREIRPSEDVPAMIEYLHRLLAVDTPRTMGFAGVWRHRKKDGTLIDVEIKWSPISFKGRLASLVMANDITDRKRVEDRNAAISKLGQSLSSATSPTEAAQIIKSVADDLFHWNAFTLDLYSSERDTIHPILNVDTNREAQRFEIPLAKQDRRPSPMARRVIERGAELILREEPLTVSNDSVLIGDTSRLSASLLLAPIRNRTKVIGILSIQSYGFKAYDLQDLTMLQTLADHCGGALERIRAEQALRESEMLFHSVWQNSVDGMRLTDENGMIVAVNDAFCNLVGMSRAELEDKPFTVIYAPSEQPEKLVQNYRQRFNERLLEKHVERRLILRNGQSVSFEDSSSFVELPGRPPLLFGLFRDVTVQKRLEDQLRQSQKMEAIGQLAGGVAHDFNNILTVIHGHASLLLAGTSLSAAAARSAQQITQAADRAATLTRQLLTFSRRQVMQPRRLDLNEVVRNMTEMLGRILGEDVALQLGYFPQPALVQADAGMIEQVLLNLAVNSRDAMPQGGLLTITIAIEEIDHIHLALHSEAHPGRHVCLSVTDTGSGIAPENLRRVFEPFFTTKEVGKGTGLGLATVYGIVKQHQGWIEVESQLDKGTGFKVYLPASNESAEPGLSYLPDPPVRGGTETILIVEDEAPVRELVCSLLSGHGYNILQAESGRDALELWRVNKDKVDLLLTDLVMPDRMNGRELAEKLWAERPELKVIFTSGYSADVVGKEFVLRRGLHYLQKPYHPKKLALIVRDCLDAAP
jgi:two-component system, cell cycle sensor histidine kinase and response regulator CckA